MNEKVLINIDQLKARLNRDLKDIEAAVSLGNAYYDKGDPGMAVLYYRHALDVDPSLSGVRTDMGAMYWRNENVSMAEQAFREVIERDPAFGFAYVNLGLLLQMAKGNVSEARSVWQKLLDINPAHDVADKARSLLQETATLIN
jgi:tetratricopeptide (TPR) repeat protein